MEGDKSGDAKFLATIYMDEVICEGRRAEGERLIARPWWKVEATYDALPVLVHKIDVLGIFAPLHGIQCWRRGYHVWAWFHYSYTCYGHDYGPQELAEARIKQYWMEYACRDCRKRLITTDTLKPKMVPSNGPYR